MDVRWFLVMGSAALALSSMSPIVAARRLGFFASALPHSALLAVSVGYALSRVLSLDPFVCSIILSLPVSYTFTFLLHRGVDTEVATSVFVAFTSSSSVAAMYLVLTRFPAEMSLWSYILGDPLLVSWSDTLAILLLAAVLTTLAVSVYKVELMVGLDVDFARVSGVRVELRDYLLTTMLTLASVGMLRVVGFVVQHVAILLPAAIGTRLARNTGQFMLVSITLSILAGILSIALALVVDIPPSALYGLLLMIAYVLSLLR
uniref:Metal ABC transporter permease n=1 Tax=Thermofilum pendens TaxID=2269 RepID=A0A7C3SM80_THEPE